MQYPVPQFTEVEDKIIGPLTLRQFLILLGAGGLVFMVYSGSKDLVITSFAALFVGIPALILAFAPFNGRPMYRSISIFISFLSSPKILVFRKESSNAASITVGTVKVAQEKSKGALEEDPRTRLKKIQYQLEQRAKQEEEILK